MKAILIDPKSCTVSEVEHNGSIDSIHEHTQASMAKMAAYSLPGHALYLDEEGQTKKGNFAFTIEGGHEPYFGRGLLVGFNARSGDDSAATVTVEQVQALVRFPKVTVGRRN